MNKSVDQFEKSSPGKVFEAADKYSKTLQRFHQIPKSLSKSMYVKDLAASKREEVKFSIEQSKYQVDLYRKLEAIDKQNRSRLEKKIVQSGQKAIDNSSEARNKKLKQSEQYSKHLHEVQKRYEQQQKKHRANQKEEAAKLRKELIQFYEKEEARKQKQALRQVSVSGCYKNALDRMNSIHRKNEQFALKAEKELEESLKKNNHYSIHIQKKRKTISELNKLKCTKIHNNSNIFETTQQRFIDKYGHNEDSSIQAFEHREEDFQSTKKRIHEFFKKRISRWHEQKKRIDEKEGQVPQKCSHILDKTTKASFRQTVSSFRDSGKQFEDIVLKNKSMIKQKDQLKKDQIMSTHLDLRLRNTSSFKVSDRMNSMRDRAKKLALDFS